MTVDAQSWIRDAPERWSRCRLKTLIGASANGVWGEDPSDDGPQVSCVRAADFDRTRQRVSTDRLPIRTIESKALRQHQLKPGDLILEKSGGGENQPVGAAVLFDLSMPAVCSNFCARITPAAGVDSRFLAYVFSTAYNQGLTQSAIKQTTGIQNLDTTAFFSSPWALPELHEQRGIADFLDAETARLDQISEVRGRQLALLDARLAQLIDGATAGDATALAAMDCPAGADTWSSQKISRLCEIVPGYAFPSADFLPGGVGVNLLRGTNIAVDKIDWTDCVSWDLPRKPIPERFHLREGDLLMGMDRPWISGGIRLAQISASDLPALLLQRVARLRPRAGTSISYVKWVLRSSHFRNAIESELTGVSVPHISADQIGNFAFRTPMAEEQDLIADALQAQADRTMNLKTHLLHQAKLIAERRQTLITAAVTGQLEVATARGVEVP